MRARWLSVVVLTGCLSAVAGEHVRHDLVVQLEPATQSIAVEDRITLAASRPAGPVEFLLAGALQVEAGAGVVEIPLGDVGSVFGIDLSDPTREAVGLKRYRVTEPPEGGVLLIRYAGEVSHALSDEQEQYTRGFRETAGLVGSQGVFLAGSTFWYPRFDDGLVEFRMEVAIPDGWHVISQGGGTSRGEDGRARWDSGGAMDEIYLVGGPLRVYRDSAGAVEALVYLHERDDALAGKYLTATAQYIEMYRELIGPYPYGKFALVENFWETGYGMPSFTLLGPTVIRLPFILHSSYPHEILHNWWGNSVFVDYGSGNWAEGLTAYLADHLIKEQRGQGVLHRRDTLQKYRNYVAQGGRDFPLAEFRSRHSAATEAVGYGKTLMVFHMLRRLVGDEDFRLALARFYRAQRGKRASWDDLRASFEETTGEDLEWFFDQWIPRPGVSDLRVNVESVSSGDDGWTVAGSIAQTQEGRPYVQDVPIVVQTGAGIVSHTLRLDGRTTAFRVADPQGRPLRLAVDPEFDLFRLLDPREIPPSIGQIFGEPEILALLPSAASADVREGYRELMEGWRSESHAIEIVADTELERLPEERAYWVLGRENRWSGIFSDRVSDGEVNLGEESVPFEGRSIVMIRRHPEDPERAAGWLVVDPPAAFAGIGRKLPHYGKYSYLAFEGDEPTNVVKGQWPTSDSPLVVDLRDPSGRDEPLPPLELPGRAALAELPPVFSARALMEHVEALASPDLEGRGAGSEGSRRAAEYIAARFEQIGLRPGGDDGTWFQRFEVPAGPDGKPYETVNVVGVLPGSRDEWEGQSVVLGAHYDHLGRGWPDVHAGDEGKIHPGADDNASGVAVMLELARNLAEDGGGSRNLVLVAFGAEEAGKLGSRHYVRSGKPFPMDEVRGAINLDTVGRLFDHPVSVLATGTADEWQHIFRGCSFVTGVPSRNVSGSYTASDQESFIEAAVPAVQIFTGAHPDYHRPTDTPEGVDAAGLVKVATFVKEALLYLLEREESLTVTIEAADATGKGPATPAGPTTGRRVRFGTIPEFDWQGPGAKIASVLPGSPAEKAGLQAGDVIVRIGDTPVDTLQGYSDVLKRLEPGQTVTARVLRDGAEVEVSVTVEAR